MSGQIKFYQVRGEIYTAESFAIAYGISQRAAAQRLNQWKTNNQGDYAYRKLTGAKRGCIPVNTAATH